MTAPIEDPHVSLDRHLAGCFYCGRMGPYTDEHVVSAGLGGDDPRWMLRGCVCTVCNNQTFSRMEAHVFKQSHIGLMRLFSQRKTRDGTPPSPLQVPTITQLGDEGPQAAGNLGAGGQSSVFAQILFERGDGEEITFPLLGPNRSSVDSLLDFLRVQLKDEVVLIQKHDARTFTTTALIWNGARYCPGKSMFVSKPPVVGIWFEAEKVPATALEVPPSTIFQSPTGQLVGRAPDLAQLGDRLSELRPHLHEIIHAFANTVVESVNAQPHVQLSMSPNFQTVDRVCVKIGLNLVAHLLGVEVVRRSNFDEAVDFVLGGCEHMRRVQLPPETFGAPTNGRHMIVLTKCLVPSGRQALVLTMRLYDAGPIDSFVLTEFADGIPLLQMVFILVDYNENRITLVSLDD